MFKWLIIPLMMTAFWSSAQAPNARQDRAAATKRTATVGLSTHSVSKYRYYAHDMSVTDQRSATLGLLNHTEETATVTLTVYNGKGEQVFQWPLSLNTLSRREFSARSLLSGENAADGWVLVTSNQPLAGFIRYNYSNGGIATTPLSHLSGGDVWLPQLADAVEGSTRQVVLLNTGEEDISVTVNPTLVEDVEDEINDEIVTRHRKVGDPQTLEGVGAALNRTNLSYDGLYASRDNHVWDRLHVADGFSLSGMQHITSDSAAAASNAQRSTFQRMVVGPLQPNSRGTFNRVVLANTTTEPLVLTITAHFGYYGASGPISAPPVDVEHILEPLEQQVLDITAVTQLINLPGRAEWISIRAFNSGLIGYQIFGAEDGSALGAVEGGVAPTGLSSLPYTPTNDDLITDIAVFNASDTRATAWIRGYDDQGNQYGRATRLLMRPYEKIEVDSASIYGENADKVTWSRVSDNKGNVYSYSVVRHRNGGDVAGLQGIPAKSFVGELWTDDFEYFNYGVITGQHWEPVIFTPGGEVDEGYVLNHWFEYDNRNLPGEFFIDDIIDGESGYFYVGYDPINTPFRVSAPDGTPERVALMSPYLEIPEHGVWHISFWMRLFDPDLTTRPSNYGLVWREEGSDTWNWFGLNGDHILIPDDIVADCWAPVLWRNLDVLATNWLPFQTTLPADLAGKRIQLGYYYEFIPDEPNSAGPWMIMDSIRIAADPIRFGIFYPFAGHGSFTTEEAKSVD